MSADATIINDNSMSRARGSRAALTTGYCCAFIALGLTTASLGPTLPSLAAQTHARIGLIGLLLTARSLGFLLASLRGGRLYDRRAGHPIMAAALAAMAALMALAPVSAQLWTLGLIMLALGAAEGLLDVGGNALLTWTHEARTVGAALNGAHFCYAVGAVVAPAVVARAIGHGIGAAYWTLALLVLPVAALFLYLPSPAARAHANDDARATQQTQLVLLFALFFALYVGAEVAFGGWIATYALARKLSDAAGAALLTSAFYGAFMFGRLLTVPLAARLRPRWILSASLSGCLLGLGLLLTDAPALVWPGACVVGFSMASIFPTTMAFAGRHIGLTGHITGRFLVGASVGGMFVPWFAGQLFEARGPRAVMLVIACDLLVALLVFAAMLRASRPAARVDIRRGRS